MSYAPIAFVSPNFRDYKDWWIKPYEPGTTTPKYMATDSTLVTLIAKAELNKDGFIKSAGSALIVPYIDGAYDLWLFPTEAEADANDTVNALRLADNITGVSGGDFDGNVNAIVIADLSQDYTFETVATYKSSVIEFPEGKIIYLKDRGAKFIVISGIGTGNDANIIASDIVNQSASLILSNTNARDVKAWGISGANAINDTAYQAALDSDVSEIHFTKSVDSYVFLASHDCTKDKAVTLAKGAVIDCTSASFSGSHFTRFLGVLTQISDLSTDVSEQSFTLPMTSATGISNDDVLVIWNPTDYSWSGFRSNYYAGEFVKVQEVSGLDVQIQSNLYDAYNSADVNIYRLDSPKCSFGGGGKVLGNLSDDLVVFEYCKDGEVDGYEFNHANNSGLAFKRCFNCHFDNVTGYNIGDGGDDYGVSFGNSQSCSGNNSNIYSRRHPVTMGGGSSAGSVPCRNIKIRNSTLKNDTDSNLHSADFHGNCEDCNYDNCKIFGGVTWQGKNNGYSNCNIIGMPSGYALLSAEIKGGTHYLDNCDVTTLARAHDASSRGHIDVGSATNAITSDTVLDATFRVLGGKFSLLNAGAGSYVMNLRNAGTDSKINIDFRPDKVDGVILAILRTTLASGTEDSDGITVGAIKGNVPKPIQLRSGGDYFDVPHSLPSCSGFEEITTDAGEITSYATPFDYPYEYPRQPHFALGRGNRTSIGGNYGIVFASTASTTKVTVGLRNESGVAWGAALTVDLSWRVGIDEI